MNGARKIRVAVAQYHVGADIDVNLSTSLRMIDQASECNPDLIVLPEFCNHLSWYQDKQHCYEVSVSLEGDFLSAISARAKELACHIVVNCTVQRDGQKATGSSLLYSPEGKLLADNTKQIYIGHENDFLERAETEGPVIETELGKVTGKLIAKLGFYACMDGVINETPRSLSLRGAQILCNSLNSFATDEGSLHIPVRAAENRVFVVAANKVGPLVPEDMIEGISEATGIPVKFLCGSGDSQIVSPDGTVLAKASADKEEVIFADIQPADADQKCRPDGTDIFSARRPELYRSIAQNPCEQNSVKWIGSSSLEAAVLDLPADGETALENAVAELEQLQSQGVRLIALPPLVTAEMCKDLDAARQFSERACRVLANSCIDSYIATALVTITDQGQYQYSSVLIGSDGICLQQGQMHFSQRFLWSAQSDEIATIDLPFGRVGLVCSDDSIYPETFRLLAIAGVEIACVALEPLESWELKTGLLERSAENRINLLVAARKTVLGSGFVTCLQKDFTLLTPWEARPFDGLLSQPVWLKMPDEERTLRAAIHPQGAANKEVSANTNLLTDRPWDLAGAIVS